MHGHSVADILRQQLSAADIPLPPQIAWHPLGRVLRSALRKNPKQRAASAAALLAQLQTVRLPPSARRTAPFAMNDWLAPSMSVTAGAESCAVLCCQVTPLEQQESLAPAHQLAQDALIDHWLAHCTDIALQYGGKLSGTLDDVLLFTFSPRSSPCLAAANAALAMQRRQDNAASPVALTLALHTDSTTDPSRTTSRSVIRLQRMALPGEILISDSARRSLEGQVDVTRGGKQLVEAPGQMPRPTFRLRGLAACALTAQGQA
jgi:hypothetical protein